MDVTNGRSVDWERIERLPEFRELVARRRRFVVPATAFFLDLVLRVHRPRRLRRGLHGPVALDGFTVGYGARADAVRHGRHARLWPTCATPSATSTRCACASPSRPRRPPAPGEPDGRGRRATRFMKGASTGRRPETATLRARRGSSRRRPGGAADDPARRRPQRARARHLRAHRRDHARDHVLGVEAHAARPRSSGPPAAASPACRTASRSPATTCRPRRSSASPA